jgi:hypothetical protein
MSNDVAGWGGGSTPVRTAVTGFGRTNAARYTSGTFMWSAPGAASPGLAYTLSVYVRSASFNITGGSIYLEWLNSGGGVISDTGGVGYTATAGIVTRVNITGTSVASTAFARIIMDGVNYAVNACDVTMLLAEQVVTLDPYFDGDDVGAVWDGTPGNSSSTLTTGAAPAGKTPGLIGQYGAFF